MEREENHYEFIDRVGEKAKKIGDLQFNPNDISVAHGDKCYGYRDDWEKEGIDFRIGALIYLMSHMLPYCAHVRNTDNGWVDVGIWVVTFYKDEKNKELINFLKSNLVKTNLPGAMITFRNAVNTGRSENSFGVGDMDISLRRTNSKYAWVDIGRINYSNPTAEQLLDAETSSIGSEGERSKSDIHRRLSFVQATYVNKLICEMLDKTFNGVIPSDDEIQELLKK